MKQSTKSSVELNERPPVINWLLRGWQLLITAALVFTIVTNLSGCKKTYEPKPVCKTLAAVYHSSGTRYFLTYNSDGKLMRRNSGDTITTYEYTGDTITVTTLNAGHFFTKSTILVNAAGLATNLRTIKDPEGTIWFNYAYEYQGGELIKSTLTISGVPDPQITRYTWANNNLASVISGTLVNTYTYYEDRPQQNGDYLLTVELFQGYETIRNKNLIKSIADAEFTYEVGDGGNISSVKVTGENHTGIFDYQLIYQCD